MSEVCEAFTIAPSVAIEQDWPLVQGILDYRNARQAIEFLNGGAEGAKKLGASPQLMDVLLRMHRARMGDDATLATLPTPEAPPEPEIVPGMA